MLIPFFFHWKEYGGLSSISTENITSDKPLPVSKVGALVKKRINEELSENPSISTLSPSVILTQRRRKEVISKLQNGTWPDDFKLPSLVVKEEDFYMPKLEPNSKDQPKFEPKWDNYDTMKTRWKTIRPQTREIFSVPPTPSFLGSEPA